MERKPTAAPRTYAVCVYCKKRSTDRALFTIDPYFPQAGVTYRCADLVACGDRGRARDAALAERRQARRDAAEAERQAAERIATDDRRAMLLSGLAGAVRELRGDDLVARQAAEYVAMIEHLCAPAADGGHGLAAESVRLVAYDLAHARHLQPDTAVASVVRDVWHAARSRPGRRRRCPRVGRHLTATVPGGAITPYGAAAVRGAVTARGGMQ